jgi:hypothetical protein
MGPPAVISPHVLPPLSSTGDNPDVIGKQISEERRIHEQLQSSDALQSEDAFRRDQKVDSVASINKLKLKPHSISRLHIPLCRMVSMPMVRPALQCDLTKLENDFVNGYRDGASVFYVSLTNEEGNQEMVSDADKLLWGPIWNEKNDHFNAYLNATPGLEKFQNSKFFVCDGNHRLLAWKSYISKNFKDNKDWHVAVDSIILDTKGQIGEAMLAMHDINKYVLLLIFLVYFSCFP